MVTNEKYIFFIAPLMTYLAEGDPIFLICANDEDHAWEIAYNDADGDISSWIEYLKDCCRVIWRHEANSTDIVGIVWANRKK